jgi:hypothetical protein
MTVAWYRLQSLFSKIGGGGLDALLVVVVVLTTLAMAGYAGGSWLRVHVVGRAHRRRILTSTPEGRVALSYDRALQTLQRRGWTREPWMTPREFLEMLRHEWTEAPEALRTLEELTRLYEQSQYAGAAAKDAPRQAEERIAALRRQAPHRPRERRPKSKPGTTPALEGAA